MRVLSLFDGISCARVALERAGIKVDKYYASEIDKYAIQIAQKNYPDTIQLGSITTMDIPKDIDLVLGGSPCQDLSAAGNRVGLDGERSGLFWKFVEVVKEINPTYFILENVASMTQDNKNIISEAIGNTYTTINASKVSAQIRNRCFWTNFQITQPDQEFIYLKDILQPRSDAVDITDRMLNKVEGTLAYTNAWKFVRTPLQKARTLTTGGSNISNTGATNIRVDGRYYKLSPIECERLMGVSDNYTEGVSNTQRYATLGNGFHVDVVAHILKCMLENKPKLEQTKLW